MNTLILTLLYGFIVLPAFCILIEHRWPQVQGYSTLRMGFGTDIVWYVVQTFVSRVVAPWAVFFAVLPIFLLSDLPLDRYWSGFGPASRLPFWSQVIIVFVVGDFLSYWQHRLFHTSPLWPIHAVHHSSASLDWLSATRFHPLNEIGAQLVYVTPLIAVGFSPYAFVVLAPFTATYAVLLHANIRLSFGPFRHVLASPKFHRWHHTLAREAQDKNFAGFLPVWDVIFGTFHHPKGQAPESFGVKEAVPDDFLGQLLYPISSGSQSGPAPARDARSQTPH